MASKVEGVSESLQLGLGFIVFFGHVWLLSRPKMLGPYFSYVFSSKFA